MPERPDTTVVFLAANASYSHTCLAGWRLRAAAEAEGWAWHEFEATIKTPMRPLLSAIAQTNPAVLAASFYLFNHDWLAGFFRRFKTLRPDCVTIGGGPEFLGDNRCIFNTRPYLDIAVRGEGESAFAEFLRNFKHTERRHSIPGLCGLSNGNYFDAGCASPPDFARLPSPYERNMQNFNKPFLLMETARGCVNRCSFCTSAGTGPVRVLTLEQTRAELQTVTQAGVREIRMADRTFNEQPSRCLKLLRMFREEFPDIRFHIEIEPARLTPALLEELSLAPPGQIHIEAGVQSFSANTLKAITRSVQISRARKNLRALCQMTNLAVHADLLAGLPGQSLKDLDEDLRELSEMGPAEIQIEILKLLPGTKLAKERERYGITASPDPPYEVLRTPGMSETDVIMAERLARLMDGLYNTPEINPILRQAFARQPELWRTMCVTPELNPQSTDSGWSLEARFKFLFTHLENEPDLQQQTVCAWLRRGLSAQRGLVPVRPWKSPVPADAILMEGDPSLPVSRMWLAETQPPVLAIYGHGPTRSAQAIFLLKIMPQ